jgi:Mg-chelatase subunit ChlD
MRTTRHHAGAGPRAPGFISSCLAASRRGSATIWGVFLMGTLLTAAALVVDGATLYTSRADLQAAADSAALAGASGLIFSPEEARSRAIEYASKNTAAGLPVVVQADDVVLGDWDPDSNSFSPVGSENENRAGAVRVTASLSTERGNALRLAFAQIFGQGEADVRASATAVYRPRDIILVLDLSGSMSYDSQIRHIPYLGKAAVEANLHQIWTELGSNVYGNMGFNTVYLSSNTTSTVINQLGLSNVPYPYPSGSWTEFVNYVRTDSILNAQGYRKRYGGLTFMDYLLVKRRAANQTPDLWMTTHQPLTAVKDAVDIFLDFIRDVATEDRVGLVVYTSANGHAQVEHGLTEDIELIRTLSRTKQAGHYHGSTNIGAGILVGKQELDQNGRSGTLKTMVLLTDGIANLPSSNPRGYVIQQANAASAAGYPIAAISLGANADHQLMRDVANITKGVSFEIPGGASVADYEEPLREVFQHIARERPLRLVR